MLASARAPLAAGPVRGLNENWHKFTFLLETSRGGWRTHTIRLTVQLKGGGGSCEPCCFFSHFLHSPTRNELLSYCQVLPSRSSTMVTAQHLSLAMHFHDLGHVWCGTPPPAPLLPMLTLPHLAPLCPHVILSHLWEHFLLLLFSATRHP